MSDSVDQVKQEKLMAMYRSVDRMNHHIANGNSQSAISEQHLQMNLRKNFEELSEDGS